MTQVHGKVTAQRQLLIEDPCAIAKAFLETAYHLYNLKRRDFSRPLSYANMRLDPQLLAIPSTLRTTPVI